MTSEEQLEKDLFFDTASTLSTIDDIVIDVARSSLKSPKQIFTAEDISLLEDDNDQLIPHAVADFNTSTIGLLKTILGAGLLAMPAAVSSVGWVPGTLFIIISAGLSQFGLQLLSKCSEKLGRSSSIASIAKATYPKLAVMIDVALALKCLGVAISYLIVIGDMVPSIAIALDIQSEILRSRNFWIVASMLLVGPLAFLRNLDSLKYTSLAGLGAVAYMCIISMLNWYKQIDLILPPGLEPVPFASITKTSLRSFPIFIFAFTAHQNICTIQNEAIIGSSAFMRKVIHRSVWISAAAYFSFSIFCYATYGASTETNVFLNFPAFRFEMIVGRILYTLLSAFSYPLVTHPCRASILNLLPLTDESKLRHFESIHKATTSGVVLATLLCSLVIRDLGIVSGLIGTFIGIPICYIIPGLFYTKMMDSEGPATLARRAAQSLIIFGILSMSISIISLIL